MQQLRLPKPVRRIESPHAKTEINAFQNSCFATCTCGVFCYCGGKQKKFKSVEDLETYQNQKTFKLYIKFLFVS